MTQVVVTVNNLKLRKKKRPTKITIFGVRRVSKTSVLDMVEYPGSQILLGEFTATSLKIGKGSKITLHHISENQYTLDTLQDFTFKADRGYSI